MTVNPKLRWIGWILFLPVAIAAYFVGYVFYKLIFWLSSKFHGPDEDSWFMEYFVPAMSAGFGGYAFVIAGTFLVPIYRKEVALILLIILAMLMGIAVFAGILKVHAITIIEGIGSVVGGVIGYFKILEDNKNI